MDLLAQIKKSVASVALAAFAFTIGLPLVNAALPFTDAAEIPSWAEEAIEELMDQGVISGNDDGSFAPNRQLNRAEVSKVIVLASGVDFDTTGGPHFPDVARDAWYYDYIETMYNYGWVNGYPDGFFRPGNGINRAEIAKMVINAFEIEQDLAGAPHFDDVSAGDWHYGYIETAYNNGLMRGYGDGTFGPANAVTRAETAHVVYNSQLVVAEPIGPAEGTMEVYLSNDTPRGTNVPYNSTSVPFITLDITASDDSDVEILSLTFTRLGLGDNDDFDNVWLEIDGFKVGNDKSVNNDDIVELRFNPPVVVPAGQTIVADVVASAKYTSTDKNVGHHNRFALVSAEDVSSTAANVVGDFPIEGEEMEVADYEVSTFTFTNLGSNTTVDVGDNFIEIGKFRLLNGSNTNKDVELRAITFKNDGTAELADDLENAALYVSGEQISAETIMDGDYITFRLDNGVTGGYVVEDGDSRIFSIRADIVSAEASDTIQFKIDNYEDIVGVEIGTSFGVKAVDASGNNAEDSYATLATYTIDSGDLNISRDPSSLGNQEYSPGSNDVVFMTGRIVVDQPLLVDGLHVWVASTSTATKVKSDGTTDKSTACAAANANSEDCFNAAFDNFRLFLNDRLIDTENDVERAAGTADDAITADNQLRLNFNTTFEIAGTSIIKLVGNISDSSDGVTTGGSDQLKFTIAATDFQSPEYISTGDQVASTQLLGSATSSFVQVQTSLLTVTETSGLTNGDNLVAGVDDVTFLQFVVDNNDSGDINVTSLTVGADATVNTDNTGTGVSGSTRTYTNFTLAVFVDGTQQGSAKNLSSTGKATFNDLSVIVPSAGQKKFTVVVDTIEASATAISLGAVTDDTSASAADVVVASVSGVTVGDLVVFSETGQTDEVRAVTAVDTANTEIDFDSTTTNNFAGGGTATIRHQLKIDIEDIDADNVENGQSVTVTDDGSTAIAVTTNEVAGTSFVLVDSGTLTVSLDSVISSDVLVANANNIEVLRIRFNAAHDEVQVKDIYLENDINGDGTADNTTAGDRVDFKIYDEAGQLLQEKTMASGALHFELANQDRIRVPKDDSTFVTIKVDVREISRANQTGTRLMLALDADNSTHKGIEAVTAATGNDISLPSAGWGDVLGQDFVAYASELHIGPAATQPSMSLPAVASTEFYRFTVTADESGNAEIKRVSMNVSLNGIAFMAEPAFITKKVVSGSPSPNQTFTTTAVNDTTLADNDTVAELQVNLNGERLAAGESRTYAVFMSNTDEMGGSAEDSDGVTVTLLRENYYSAPTTQALQLLTNSGEAATGAAAGVTDQYSTTVFETTQTEAAAFAVGNVIYAIDTGTVANSKLNTVSAIAAGTDAGSVIITVGTAMTATFAATDELVTMGTYATGAAAGATDQYSTTVMEVSATDAVKFSVGDAVYAIDISVPGNNATNTISSITAGTDANSYLITVGTAMTAAFAAGDYIVLDREQYVVWSDESDPSHSSATSDWLNGYLLDIDNNGTRISKN
ncbi:S-layer homology domain-containing protein [Candidatus Gracilibacteria bacterium]|nr:S-layer homology domain-containing protein [Candidatus Gracilibacteria bacterium]